MSKRLVITEEERNEIRGKYNLMEQDSNGYGDVSVQMAKVRPDAGCKYCFDPKKFTRDVIGGANTSLKLHKIKQGDTLSGIISNIPSHDKNELLNDNSLCPLKLGLKVGDVIIVNWQPM